MKMTREQRADYRSLIREAKYAKKFLNRAVEHYNRVVEEAFDQVEMREQDFADAMAACEGFCLSMVDEDGAEKSWGKFIAANPCTRVGPVVLDLEDGVSLDEFIALEKKK
jgi:hypothetical protein